MDTKNELFHKIYAKAYIRKGELERAIKSYKSIGKQLTYNEYKECGINAFKNGLYYFGTKAFGYIDEKPTLELLQDCINYLMDNEAYERASEPIKEMASILEITR